MGVIADFVALCGDAPRESGETLYVLAAEKKGGPDPGLLQEVEDPRGLLSGTVVEGQSDGLGIAQAAGETPAEPLRFGRGDGVPDQDSERC